MEWLNFCNCSYAALILLFVISLLLFIWQRKTSQMSGFPGLPSVPILGTSLYLKRDPYELGIQIRTFMTDNGFMCLVWLSYLPLLLCGRAEYAEVVLKNSTHLTKSTFYSFLHEWLGTGLLTSDGTKWKTRRRSLTPSFHFGILVSFVEMIENEAKLLVEKLRDFADTGKAVDIQTPVSLAALDVICQTAMGVSVHAQKQSSSPYVSAIISMTSQVQLRQKSPWLWSNFFYRFTSAGRKWYKDLAMVHEFTTSVIKQRIESRNDSDTNKSSTDALKKKAFLDALLELHDKGEIDVDGIREEVDTFMFEGHDTTASAVSWTLYRLGRNPDVQKKLHDEIDKIAQRDGDLIGKIKDCKYLDYVMKEGLRMHSPVPLFARVLSEDVVIDGNFIPKGTNIGVAPIALHYNPEYWDDPYAFNPDRFASEKFLNRHPYSYVPFSAGPRNCIGQKFAVLEDKIFLYYVMLNFEIEAIQHEEEDVRICYEIIHKSDNGLLLKLKCRIKD